MEYTDTCNENPCVTVIRGNCGVSFPTECWGWSPYNILRKRIFWDSHRRIGDFLLEWNDISGFPKSHFPSFSYRSVVGFPVKLSMGYAKMHINSVVNLFSPPIPVTKISLSCFCYLLSFVRKDSFEIHNVDLYTHHVFPILMLLGIWIISNAWQLWTIMLEYVFIVHIANKYFYSMEYTWGWKLWIIVNHSRLWYIV